MKDIISVATINFRLSPEGKSQNLKRIAEYSISAARRGADLVLFPELCLTGYDFLADLNIPIKDKKALAEDLSGQSTEIIAEISKKYEIYIVYGAPELDKKKDALYNSAFITGPDGIIGTYRKIHPYDEENIIFAKGDEPFIFDTPWGPIGTGICYDSYQFPELLRYYVSKGVRLYLNPTAELEELPLPESRQAFYDYYSLLEAAVRCNYVYIASANLTGYDRKTYFAGGSCIIGPSTGPFTETNIYYYGGSRENYQETLDLTTIDLSLATRALCKPQKNNPSPDYRPEIYKNFR